MASEFKLKGLTSIDLKNGQKQECEVEGVEGGKVLLVKAQDGLHAMSPNCTHYGAPLMKGVVTGDGRITCPWHGACFKISTGDVEDAPALDPLAKFKVVQKDGAVYISGEESALKAGRRKLNIKCSAKSQEHTVIVGGGSGALGAIEGLRGGGYSGKITVISSEPYQPIDRTKLSKALITDLSKIAWRSEDFYKEGDVELVTGKSVKSVDFKGKTVTSEDGKSFSYSKLILASGGIPKYLPMEGLKGDLGNVFLIRSLPDAQAIMNAAGQDGGKKIVIVGSSFIGMEVGNALAGMKHDVTIVGMEEEPMQGVMGKEIGSSATAGDRRGMWSMVKEGYEGLVSTVIRPLRSQYAPSDLGPKRAQIGDVSVQRVDLKLKNPAGYTLECSWWKPRKPKSGEIHEQDKLPCIVVLHGNSSCRLGALEIVMYALPAGFTVFALDFSGSGLSEGKYVSLGYHEQTDIATAVKYVRKTKEASSLCLWGRSMGAVAALLYAQTDSSVNAMVLDSPFSSLPKLATELVEDGKLGVPKIAVKLVMRLIRRDIKKRAKFDMFKLKPIAKVHKCSVPAFFVVGLQDELVGPHHVEALYKLHNGPNQLFKFPGGHNSPRPFNFFIQALQFLRVMVGLMPLPDDLSTFDLSPAQRQQVQTGKSDKKVSPKRKKPSRVYKNPLGPGVSIEAVHKMSIKELKQCIDRAGYSDVTCIEKKEMVDLVLKLYARYRRSSKQAANDRQPTVTVSTSDEGEPDTTPSSKRSLSVESKPAPPLDTSDTTSSGRHSPTPKGRRRSEGDVHALSTAGAIESPSLLSSMKSNASSILSDAELARRLSIDHLSDMEDDTDSDKAAQ